MPLIISLISIRGRPPGRSQRLLVVEDDPSLEGKSKELADFPSKRRDSPESASFAVGRTSFVARTRCASGIKVLMISHCSSVNALCDMMFSLLSLPVFFAINERPRVADCLRQSDSLWLANRSSDWRKGTREL